MIKVLISDLSKIIENENFLFSFKDTYKEGKLLFVPSNPNDKKTTEKYGKTMCQLFEENGLFFSKVEYLYENSNLEEITNKINDYSLILLMGGVTLIQNEFVLRIRLKEMLENYDGILMGLSAGALNMCEHTIDTPVDPEYDENIQVKGLGITDIVVEVHFDHSEAIKEPKLPEGYYIKTLSELSELSDTSKVIQIYGDCLGMGFDEYSLRNKNKFEVYRDELDIIVMNPDHKPVALCSGRYDEKNKMVSFEAVACFRDHRRKGISKAMMLYESAGFKLVGNRYTWKKIKE